MRTKTKQPFVATANQQESILKFIPNVSDIEDYKPKGYEFVEDLFVDNSGFGVPGEAALTRTEFIKKIKEGFGYAITGVGQFQVYVSVFKKK